jgi:hypothetical protein
MLEHGHLILEIITGIENHLSCKPHSLSRWFVFKHTISFFWPEKCYCVIKKYRFGQSVLCGAKTQYREFETNIPRKGITRPQSPFSTFMCLCVWERFIYSHDRSAYSAAGKYVDRSWEYINRSHRQMNGEIGTRNSFPGNT